MSYYLPIKVARLLFLKESALPCSVCGEINAHRHIWGSFSCYNPLQKLLAAPTQGFMPYDSVIPHLAKLPRKPSEKREKFSAKATHFSIGYKSQTVELDIILLCLYLLSYN